jgi:hypothetical protein
MRLEPLRGLHDNSWPEASISNKTNQKRDIETTLFYIRAALGSKST